MKLGVRVRLRDGRVKTYHIVDCSIPRTLAEFVSWMDEVHSQANAADPGQIRAILVEVPKTPLLKVAA